MNTSKYQRLISPSLSLYTCITLNLAFNPERIWAVHDPGQILSSTTTSKCYDPLSASVNVCICSLYLCFLIERT